MPTTATPIEALLKQYCPKCGRQVGIIYVAAETATEADRYEILPCMNSECQENDPTMR